MLRFRTALGRLGTGSYHPRSYTPRILHKRGRVERRNLHTLDYIKFK